LDLIGEIKKLKEKRDAVILAHNYQIPEVQDIADYVGDSLELARLASSLKNKTIVFCGVRFMAETAKVLSPDKTVLLPEKDAGCPMADMILPEQLENLRSQYPGAQVVAYVNTSVEVKALSDICCTSSNAVKVVDSVSSDEIIFVPDRNLATWVSLKSKKKIICHPGFCIVHENVKPSDVLKMKELYPESIILAHPECSLEVLKLADSVQSTGGMIRYVSGSDKKEFIIVTEQGMNYRLSKLFPDRIFHSMTPEMICFNMKKTTVESVFFALKENRYEIILLKELIEKASIPLKRMLMLG